MESANETSRKKLLETIEKSTFIRVHRAFAVNLKHVYQIEENDVIFYSRAMRLKEVYMENLFLLLL